MTVTTTAATTVDVSEEALAALTERLAETAAQYDLTGEFPWAGVQAALPPDVRACAYDRPGTGASDAVRGVRSPDDDLADLHAALEAAGV